jgi:pyrrolidone-carboxylate peptidase
MRPLRRTLVTGFRPFGFIRRLQQKNASAEVLDLLQSRAPSGVLFHVLPVSGQAEAELVQLLEYERPDAVVCLGETLAGWPSGVKLEAYARDVPASTLPRLGGLESVVVSKEALRLGAKAANCSIGSYYCNRVYLAALQWAEGDPRRTALFFHVPVLGRRQSHADQIMQHLEALGGQWHR